MLAAGFLLTNIATIRAGAFSPRIGYLLLAAAAEYVFLFFVAEFLPQSQAASAVSCSACP